MLTDQIKEEIVDITNRLAVSELKKLMSRHPENIEDIHAFLNSFEALNRQNEIEPYFEFLTALDVPKNPLIQLQIALRQEYTSPEVVVDILSKIPSLPSNFAINGLPILSCILETPTLCEKPQTTIMIISLLLSHGIDPNLKHPETQALPVEAALETAPEIFEYLLTRTRDIDQKSAFGEGDTIIQQTLYEVDTRYLAAAIRAGSNLFAYDDEGYSLMTRACILSSTVTDKLALLVQSGLSVNMPDEKGRLPLQTALLAQNDKIAVFLMNNGADITKLTMLAKYVSLIYVIDALEPKLVSQILNSIPKEKQAEFVNNMTNAGTPLIRLCQDASIHSIIHPSSEPFKRQTAILQLLCDVGADVSLPDRAGTLPIATAINRTTPAAVFFLLKREVSIATLTREQLSALANLIIMYDIATNKLQEIRDSIPENELAAFLNHITPRSDTHRLAGHTLVTLCIKYGRLETLMMWLNLGASIEVSTLISEQHHTPLTYAIKNLVNTKRMSLIFIETLLRHGANPNVTLPDGSTPLLISIQGAREDIALCLVKHDADMNLETAAGHPAFYAAKTGFRDLLTFGLENGLNPNARVEDIPLILYAAACDSLVDKGSIEREGVLGDRDKAANLIIYVTNVLQTGKSFDKKTHLHETTLTALLLQYKANPAMALENGISGIHIAVASNNLALIRLLVKHDPELLNVVLDGGSTLFCYIESTNALDTLMACYQQYGISPPIDRVNKLGLSAINYLTPNVILPLIKLGASPKFAPSFFSELEKANFADPNIYGILRFFQASLSDKSHQLNLIYLMLNTIYHPLKALLAQSTDLSDDTLDIISEYDDPFVRYPTLAVSRNAQSIARCANGVLTKQSLFRYINACRVSVAENDAEDKHQSKRAKV